MLPKRSALLWSCFALALASCGASSVVQAAADNGLPRGALDPGRSLRSYSWDGLASVPWLSAPAPASLPFGELGRTPLTGLYLTFNHDLAAEAAVQPVGWGLSAAGFVPCPGRFGAGVSLAPDSVLRCELPDEARGLRAWTLEFWLRPTRLAQAELLALTDQLSVALDAQGRLAVRLSAAGVEAEGVPLPRGFLHPTALVAGQWNHVALVLDLEDARSLRAVVNGEAQALRLDPAGVPARSGALVLGDVHRTANGVAGALDELRFLARNTSTAELGEHWRCERKALERLRLSYAEGEEELELWRAPQSEPRLDSAEEWAQGELVHAYASEAGLAWTREHWRRIECDERPVARTTHPLVSLGHGRVFVIGGETRDTHLGPTANTNDTWIFDGTDESWSRVPTPAALTPRCHMPVAYSPDHDLVLLFGGWWQGGWWSQDERRTLGDTWVFHVSERRWEQRAPGGEPPPQLSDNGLVYLPTERRFLLLVGERSWTYDPDADVWEARPPMRVVDKRSQHPIRDNTGIGSFSCALDPRTGQVLLFGGCTFADSSEFLDRTALYDPATNTLTVLDLPLYPSGRVRGALAFDPLRERFVLFGGVREQLSRRFDDLWIFDPRAQRWNEVASTGARPDARGGYFGLAYDEEADHFVLPAGRHAPNSWLDETWTLVLDERRTGTARYLFDRAAFAADVWFCECETPAGSALHFRFRAGSDGMRFGAWNESLPAEGRYVEVEVELVPGSGGAGPRVQAMGFRAETRTAARQ